MNVFEALSQWRADSWKIEGVFAVESEGEIVDECRNNEGTRLNYKETIVVNYKKSP